MKYLGEWSLSSLVYRTLQVMVILIPIATSLLIFILAVASFSAPVSDPTVSPFAHFQYELLNEVSKDPEAKEILREAPVFIKAFMFLFIITVATLLFSIVWISVDLFKNFSNNIVFSDSNTKILHGLNKLVIAFAIITFNLSTLLIGIILLIFTEVLKNGTALKEESDLTV